ncbi:hypothetical protein Tco_1540318 [Tanacetum coccineum]
MLIQISYLARCLFFTYQCLKFRQGVIQILESLRSKFFNGHESSGKKASWVQWKKALAPKDNGGLATLWSRVLKAIHGANGKIDEDFWKTLGNGLVDLILDDVVVMGASLRKDSLEPDNPKRRAELTSSFEELAKVINPVVLTQSPDSWSFDMEQFWWL